MDVEEDFVIDAFKCNISNKVAFDVFFKDNFVLEEAIAACWAIVGKEVPSVG